MEITINYFARQHVDEKHEFIKETLSTSKETYRHSLVPDHGFASITTKLDEENTQVYEQKPYCKRTINGGLLPKIGLIS